MRSCVFFVFCAVCAVCACDDGGRAARRDGAIDVAGVWADEDSGAVVTIDNEADKNDVVVTVARDAVFAVEKDLVARVVGADVDGRVVVMGRGTDALRDEVRGGENVSFDGGASTVVDVDGDDVAAEASAGAEDAALRWSLRVRGDRDGLDGVLRLSLRERRPRASDVDGASTESEQVETPLRLTPAVP